MTVSNVEELEEALEELLPTGYSIETDKHGQLIIFTGLQEDEDGELSIMENEEDEELDPDTEHLKDEDEDEDD